MPQLGSDTHFTDSVAHAYGPTPYNQVAARLTMPDEGIITHVGMWLRSYQGATSMRLCLWAPDGSLLAQSASFTPSNASAGLGNSQRFERALQTPVTRGAGANVYVGVARNPNGGLQFDRRHGGDPQQYRTRQRDNWPGSMAGYDVVNGSRPCVWLQWEPGTPEVYVRRGGTWDRVDGVYVRRSGSWAKADSVSVRRSGSWTEV